MAKRRRSRKDLDWFGVLILIGVGGFLLLAMVMGAVLSNDGSGGYDRLTLCPRDIAYPHTIVLIDGTDPFSATQQKILSDVITEAGRDLATGEKLSIYVLDDRNYGTAAPIFGLCNPGRGEDLNPLYQNPERARRVFDEKFGSPLRTALAHLTTVKESPVSPIMEMLTAISFVPDFDINHAPRRLIIFSDLLHNMPYYSQYRDPVDYTFFDRTDKARLVTPNLGGVQVELLYLLRPGAGQYQTRAHVAFWEHLIDATGATLTEVRPIP